MCVCVVWMFRMTSAIITFLMGSPPGLVLAQFNICSGGSLMLWIYAHVWPSMCDYICIYVYICVYVVSVVCISATRLIDTIAVPHIAQHTLQHRPKCMSMTPQLRCIKPSVHTSMSMFIILSYTLKSTHHSSAAPCRH